MPPVPKTPSSAVLRKIKNKARQLAEEDYKKNIKRKNKSAFISRQTEYYYSKLLEEHFKRAENDKAVLSRYNTDCNATNAKLKQHIRRLQTEIHFQELVRDLSTSASRP